MISTLFLVIALFPVMIGLGYILTPRKMKKIQAWFRKRLEKVEVRFYKAHRKVGLGFLGLGCLMLFTYFQPIWIYNMFVAARIVMGVFFPEAFQEFQPVQAIPMVCI
ncbi:MAG TPA: hypothetical protein VLJ37_12125 [bacterium]|nr:hypothetical protein [bacterium]